MLYFLLAHLYKDLMDETCLRLLKDIHDVTRLRPEMRGQIENIYMKTGNFHLINDIMQTAKAQDVIAMEES